jgi:hypothetical protein
VNNSLKTIVVLVGVVVGACGGGGGGSSAGSSSSSSGSSGSSSSGSTSGGGTYTDPHTNWQAGPAAGNPSGTYTVPAEAGADDVSAPDHVVGTGTAASCTADAFIQAVALGGKITFNCGPDAVTITLSRPAKVFNNKPDVVIDGKGLVTLSGGGSTRILYMNTCDQSLVWTTSRCDNQEQPRLTVQNLTFIDANSKGEAADYDGGGAIWVRGGRFKVVNSRFFNNVCADVGPDVGGAAIRVFDQYQGLPVFVTHSTFGGASGYGNTGSNGGAISSIGVSWTIYNSLFSYNRAIGNGGNPATSGPGGGSGGAIYNDGNRMTLTLYGTLIEHNEVNAYGSAIFFVTNDMTGSLHIEDSVIRNNTGGSWYTLPGISMHPTTTRQIVNSTIQ